MFCLCDINMCSKVVCYDLNNFIIITLVSLFLYDQQNYKFHLLLKRYNLLTVYQKNKTFSYLIVQHLLKKKLNKKELLTHVYSNQLP